jgi:hypothetical protein
MYQAYDRHKWERIPEESSNNAAMALAPHPDCRVIVHPLRLCPPLPKETRYQLVYRRWPGQRVVLGIGRARSTYETLNLADVRRAAAQLGANEVHVLPTG